MVWVNIFLSLCRRDHKPAARAATGRVPVAREITAALYTSSSHRVLRVPP